MERIRSLLFAPGVDAHKLERVFTFGSDAVDLDLEDSVPVSKKTEARELVSAVLERRKNLGKPKIVVRVNGPRTGLLEDDLRAVVREGVWAIHLTKVGSAKDVARCSMLVEELERERGMVPGSIRFICSADSAHVVLHLREMIHASSRLYCFIVGGIDFAHDLRTTISPRMVESFWARAYAVLVSRDEGIAPPLQPAGFTLDIETLRPLLLEARQLGFQGATAIHPKTVPIIHEIFTPTEEQVRWARRIVDAFREEEAKGRAAFMLGNEFVDYAVVQEAKDILEAAGLTVE